MKRLLTILATPLVLLACGGGEERKLQSMTPESVGCKEVILGRNLNYLYAGFDSNLVVGPPIEEVCSAMSTPGGNSQEGEDKFEIFLKKLRIQKFAVFDYGNSASSTKVGLYFDDSATTKEMLMGYLISMHYVKSLEADAGSDRTVDNEILLEKSHLFGDRMIDDYVLQLESNGWNVDNIYIDEKNMGRLSQGVSSVD